MSEKKYYWLKLDKDFFRSKRIKKLRKLAGGDTFTIIYLKMQLLSLTTDGCLEYTGLENSFEEELALDIDEDIENIKITVSYLLKCGLLVENDTFEYSMPFVQNSIGSETSVAERVRRHRENQKALQCNTDETHMKQICNVEIEKEIEKELEIDKETDKKKEKEPYFPDEELNQAFLDYMDMRKKIKSPMTKKAVSLAIKKLNELAKIPFSEEIDREMAINILNQSVMNSWKGLFPIKGERKEKVDWDNV
jgi:predicted phage replisome organizer